MNKVILTFALVSAVEALVAQSALSGSSIFVYVLAGLAIVLFFSMIIKVANNLIGIEAQRQGINMEDDGMTLLPGLQHFFKGKAPEFTMGTPTHLLNKGHDILLEGEATGAAAPATGVTRYAVQPPNFRGLKPIPKMTVEVGDTVKAGDQLFFDKGMPDVVFAAPVSGEVIEINRGAKRAITEVVILADKEQTSRSYEVPNLAEASRADLVEFIKGSGAWSLFRQRPFNIVASPNETPRDIFVSTFDTAPLAPDANVVVAGQEVAFQRGVDVLAQLTDGDVYLGLDARGDVAPAAVFAEAANAKKHYFRGKHPAGNVGVQIHHIAPVGGTDIIWTLGVQDVITLGKLFLNGVYDASRVVALAGAELKEPKYVQTYAGANIDELLSGNIATDNVRIISGDVLSGAKKDANSYLDFYDDQISVIEEGDFYELFGWLAPIELRPTISNTFPNFIFSDVKFRANTNTHGEKRAFVVTNDYEQVMPMDVYPAHIMKSVLVNDIERMEGLGILELVEEDVALCEFVCVSKQPLQQILRRGLDTIRDQG
ncbi:MAG: Na(+)-translocating NADH-quinone reductase subunit A [Bacteroidota bacterium]